MSESIGICKICKRDVKKDEAVKCVICGSVMHRRCIDEEILTDSVGDYLCPYCAAISALDWFDSVITQFPGAFSKDEKEELIARLKSYLNILEKPR